MQTGIYEIVNTVNGKRYVGSSVDIKKRWQAHILELRKGTHHAQHLQRSFNKYGEDKFILVIIRYCDKDELIAYEQEELDSGFDYNSSPTAQSTLGLKFSDEARERVRQNRLQRMRDDPEGYSALMSSISKGKPKSEEWKEKASKRWAGVKKSDEQTNKMRRSRSPLDDDKVREVRSLRPICRTLKEVAERAGVTKSQAQSICSGSGYFWVE